MGRAEGRPLKTSTVKLAITPWCQVTINETDVHKLTPLPSQNFELKARLERYKIFSKYQDSLIVLGHHIDDSFEWSLMQKMKSSRLESTIGIPLYNKNYIRPLMCVTKKQIRRYAKILKCLSCVMETSSVMTVKFTFVRSLEITRSPPLARMGTTT